MPALHKPKKRPKKKRVPKKKKRVQHHYRRRGPGLLQLIHDELKRKVPPPGFKRIKFEPYRPPPPPPVAADSRLPNLSNLGFLDPNALVRRPAV